MKTPGQNSWVPAIFWQQLGSRQNQVVSWCGDCAIKMDIDQQNRCCIVSCTRIWEAGFRSPPFDQMAPKLVNGKQKKNFKAITKTSGILEIIQERKHLQSCENQVKNQFLEDVGN